MKRVDLRVRPVFIVTSSAATKSVKTASTSSNPARTFIISELGFVYFFGSTEAKKAVMVFLVSLAFYQGMVDSYIQSMGICRGTSCFDTTYCP